MPIYLLHFSRKLHHARHYLGSTRNLEGRLYYHIQGRGSSMTRAAVARRIQLTLDWVWEEDRDFEKQLKRQKHAERFCPICNLGEKT